MDTKKWAIVVFLTILLSLSAITFVFADSLEVINFFNPAGFNPVENSRINGTVRFNFTTLGSNTSLGMTANITSIEMFFTRFNDNNIISGGSATGDSTDFNISSAANISFDTSTLPDGKYNMTFNITNVTGDVTTNRTITNITIDNTAPVITYVDSTPADAGSLGGAASILVNVTINDTTPINITFTFANSTTVNSTTFINHFNGLYLENDVQARNVSYNFSLDNSDATETWTYNVTVIDQYLRSTTTASRTTGSDVTAPIVTVTSSEGSSISTSAETIMTCSISEANPSTLTLNQGTTSICSSSGGVSCSATFTYTSSGDRPFTCTATDDAGNTGTGTYTLSIVSGGGSSASSGGSGGSRSVTYTNIIEGESPSFKISDSILGVDEVSFTAATDLSRAKVEVFSKLASELSTTPENQVYKYFEITTDGFTNEDITEVTTVFSISDVWLTQNNADTDDVILLRLEGDEWVTYDATLLRVESGLHYFEASTPGLSIYAASLKILTGAGAELTAPETTAPEVSEEGVEEVVLDREKPKSKRWLVLAIAIVLIAVAGWIFYTAQQNKGPPHLRKRR